MVLLALSGTFSSVRLVVSYKLRLYFFFPEPDALISQLSVSLFIYDLTIALLV